MQLHQVQLKLARTRRDRYGTFGVLLLDGHQPFCTVEPPWVEWSAKGDVSHPFGKPYKSCLPIGSYQLLYRQSPKYGWRWHVTGKGVDLAPGPDVARFACLFHPANWPRDLQGCIALGETHTTVGGAFGINKSGAALKRFESAIEHAQNSSVSLLIVDC